MDRVRGELMATQGSEPSIEEIAAALKIPEEEAQVLAKASRQPASLNGAPGAEQDDASLQDFLGDTDTPDLTRQVDLRLLRERLDEVLRCLSPRYREVLELRFGLHDGHPQALDQIAERLGITRERVRQIEARGLEKLRHPDRRARLAGFAEVA
jgi:RNA polymerase primary sigma factor